MAVKLTWLTKIYHKVADAVINWLTEETSEPVMPLIDFNRLSERLRPADVVLIEGRSRVAGIIQAVTLSSWSHAALYIGRLGDLQDQTLRERLQMEHGWQPDQQMFIEAEMGRDVMITPIEQYKSYHMRICRPRKLSAPDAQRVIGFAIGRMDIKYDNRQVFDLLRFFFPYGLLPRRWRSTLFEIQAGDLAKGVCSTLIAEAFASVRFPILPVAYRSDDNKVAFHRMNARLVTPRDFDYSPYFEIIKYPFFGGRDLRIYRDMVWDNRGVVGLAGSENDKDDNN